MADYYINVILDDAKLKTIEAAGLADKVVTIDGKKAVQVERSRKNWSKDLPAWLSIPPTPVFFPRRRKPSC